MSFVCSWFLNVLRIVVGMVFFPRTDWHKFFSSHGIEPDCEPRFPLTEFDEVDGRMGWQWLVSIKGYLDWRSGRDWQNWQQRAALKDETDYYVLALNFLNCEVRHFGDALPRAEAKKKPQSVKAKSAKAGAR